MIKGVKEASQRRGQRSVHDLTVEQTGAQNPKSKPEDALSVHEARRVWPQVIIDHVRQHRDRLPEGGFKVGIDPPREKADADHALIASNIPISKTEGIDRFAAYF